MEWTGYVGIGLLILSGIGLCIALIGPDFTLADPNVAYRPSRGPRFPRNR